MRAFRALWWCVAVVCLSGVVAADGPRAGPATAGDESPPVRLRVSVDVSRAVLRLYVLDEERAYVRLAVDIYSVESRSLVYSGTTADPGAGEYAPEIQLTPGTYKIVRRGTGYGELVDFAAVTLEPDRTIDYLVVVRSGSHEFRGTGVVTSPLPKGLHVAGARVSMSGAGTLMLNASRDVPRQTNGLSGQLGLFGNAAVEWDFGPHRIEAKSSLQLSVVAPKYGTAFAAFDQFRGHVLYAFTPKSPYARLYARAGFQTAVAPGYLYLDDDDGDAVSITIERSDGRVETAVAGSGASLDDLRIRLAPAWAPLILQQEIGADLKAFQADLRLARVGVETRIGYGLRQGLTGSMLVVDNGVEVGPDVRLREVASYATHGPLVGATANATFARWLYGQADLDLMVPVQNRSRAGAGLAEQLLFGLSATATVKLPNLGERFFASFDYTVRMQRDGFIVDSLQLDQTLMMRANVSIL